MHRILPLTSERLTGVEKSKRNDVNQNILCHTEKQIKQSKAIPRSMCDQVPEGEAACNLQRRLEDAEHGERKAECSRESVWTFSSGITVINM